MEIMIIILSIASIAQSIIFTLYIQSQMKLYHSILDTQKYFLDWIDQQIKLDKNFDARIKAQEYKDHFAFRKN